MWHTYRMELLSSPKRRGYLAIWDKLNTFILKVTADFWLGQDRGSLIQQPLLCRLQVKFKTRGQRNIHLQLYEVNTNRQMRPGSKAEYQPVRGLWCFFPVSCLLAYPKQVMPNSSLKLKTRIHPLLFSQKSEKVWDLHNEEWGRSSPSISFPPWLSHLPCNLSDDRGI